MVTTQMTSATADQVNEHLNTTLTNGGTAVQNGLIGITLVHKARLSQQQRYAAALEKEYGAQDSGVKAAQAKVAATKMVIAQVTAAQQQAATPAPTVSADEWALQGRIYDANSQPIAKLTVFLVDCEKIWLRHYGFAYTDETGYFLLKGAYPTDSSAPIYIEIANAEGLPIYLDSTSFAPVKGQAVYKKIVSTSQSPLGDPPCEIRREGLPDKG